MLCQECHRNAKELNKGRLKQSQRQALRTLPTIIPIVQRSMKIAGAMERVAPKQTVVEAQRVTVAKPAVVVRVHRRALTVAPCNDGSTRTTSEGGSSNENTQTTGGLATPLTREDIPGLVRELARHFCTDNQDPPLSLVPGMFVTCDYILCGFRVSLSPWVVE